MLRSMVGMQQICTHCQSAFDITHDDLAFYEKISPVFNGKKELIPPPTHCPDCRQQRRLACINELNLVPDQCDLCKKRILTHYSPDRRPPTVYCRECWNSEQYNPCDYGRDVDFSRPFLEQICELRNQSPCINLYTGPSLQNSEYVQSVDYLKNCYLIMHADLCEDCYYGYGFKKDKSCVDGYYNFRCEYCYDCIDCHDCYGVIGSQDCMNCSSSGFLRDCIGCRNCYLSIGLRNKEYCFENEQLDKETYNQKLAAINTGSHRTYQTLKNRRQELERAHPFREFQGHQLENCLGNNLYGCKNAYRCFDCEDVEDARYCAQVVTGGKNICDVYQWGMNLQSAYECSHAGNDAYNIFFSVQTFLSSDICCSWFSQSCHDCFGCANNKFGRYRILNKQYTKDEYEALVPRIIDHMRQTREWGEFFPCSMSLFGYNKTMAQLYFPLSQEESAAKGYLWDADEPAPTSAIGLAADALPDDIRDATDDVLTTPLLCEGTGKPFKIIAQELAFHRTHNVPLPRRSWLRRHLDRFAQRNPRTLWSRQCAKCQKAIETTYAPDRPEIVYCEQCYLETVY